MERDGRVKVGFYEIGISGAKWANSILKHKKEYAVNHNRINQLNLVIRVMKRVEKKMN